MESIPHELVEKMLMGLDYPDLMTIKGTSSSFQDLLSSESEFWDRKVNNDFPASIFDLWLKDERAFDFYKRIKTDHIYIFEWVANDGDYGYEIAGTDPVVFMRELIGEEIYTSKEDPFVKEPWFETLEVRLVPLMEEIFPFDYPLLGDISYERYWVRGDIRDWPLVFPQMEYRLKKEDGQEISFIPQ